MLRRSIAVIAFACCGTAAAQSTAPPRVVAPAKLAQYWVMVNSSVEADVPNIAKNISAPGCAAVSFVIEKNGQTSTVKAQRVAPQGDFSGIALSEASALKFTPSLSNAGRDRVFSWLIFPFNLPRDPAARTAVMQQCQVEKLDWKDR